MVIDYSQTINCLTYLGAYPLPRINDQINEIVKCKIYSTLDLKSAYYQIPLAKSDWEFTAFEANGKLYQYCRLPFGVTNGVVAFQRIIDNLIERYKLQNTFAYLDNVTVAGMSQEDHDKNLQALCIDEDEPFTVECDASEYAIGAVLNQGGRPVAFMPPTLSPSECCYPCVEKEATSIMEAVRKWVHYLHGWTFTLITDQKSVAFMFNPEGKSKIKNAKNQQ